MTTTSIFSECVHAPPVDTEFVAGRWHHNRVTPSGFWVEAKVYAKSLTVPYNANTRFLILGRARSGTTLLTQLLNAHSQVHCDEEILHSNVLSPYTFFKKIAGKSRSPVYGAKLLSYQMCQVHRMEDPRAFVARLVEDGVQMIHLKRETFAQTLSLLIAQKRAQYHSDRGAKPLGQKQTIDPQDFSARLKWSEMLLRYEEAALEGFGATYIDYDRDLTSEDSQENLLSGLCDQFGIPQETISVGLKKVLPKHPRDTIENYDELCSKLTEHGLDHLIPKDD